MRGDKNIAYGPNTGPALANNIPKTDDVFTQYLSVNVNDTLIVPFFVPFTALIVPFLFRSPR